MNASGNLSLASGWQENYYRHTAVWLSVLVISLNIRPHQEWHEKKNVAQTFGRRPLTNNKLTDYTELYSNRRKGWAYVQKI